MASGAPWVSAVRSPLAERYQEAADGFLARSRPGWKSVRRFFEGAGGVVFVAARPTSRSWEFYALRLEDGAPSLAGPFSVERQAVRAAREAAHPNRKGARP